jgi:hypothetical protein
LQRNFQCAAGIGAACNEYLDDPLVAMDDCRRVTGVAPR